MSTKMRAVLVKNGKGPSDALYIGDAEKPTPKSEEVLVKVIAFGLNRMDIGQRNGNYPPPPGVTDILGVEFSGTIAELSPGGSRKWKVGDEVLGLAFGGAYAEYVAVSENTILLKPPTLSWVEAAGIPENFFTAYQAIIQIGEVKQGDNVMVHAGASGVGIAAEQLAHLQHADHIIATTSSAEKISHLNEIPNGPTDCINYKTQDFASEAKKITGGKGVDVIVDFIGKDYWEKNIDSLAIDGTLVLQGLLSGGEVSSLSLGPLLRKRLRIQGSTLRSRAPAYQAKLVAEFAKELLPRFRGSGEGKGELKVHIHKVYSWEKIKEAHDEMEDNKNVGKIVAEVS